MDFKSIKNWVITAFLKVLEDRLYPTRNQLNCHRCDFPPPSHFSPPPQLLLVLRKMLLQDVMYKKPGGWGWGVGEETAIGLELHLWTREEGILGDTPS